MTCRFSRYFMSTDLVRKPRLIPMSAADRREAEELNRRREARRQAQEARRAAAGQNPGCAS